MNYHLVFHVELEASGVRRAKLGSSQLWVHPEGKESPDLLPDAVLSPGKAGLPVCTTCTSRRARQHLVVPRTGTGGCGQLPGSEGQVGDTGAGVSSTAAKVQAATFLKHQQSTNYGVSSWQGSWSRGHTSKSASSSSRAGWDRICVWCV